MTMMQPLKENDLILIVAPARSINTKKLNSAVSTLQSWGLRVQEAPFLRKKHHQFAGTDLQRTEDLQWALDHPEAKAIVCFRGGYGTTRIIQNIDFEGFLKCPKWVCGYSDVTVLHNAINKLRMPSLHSTMPINFEQNTPIALQSLKDALFGKPHSFDLATHPFNQTGTVTGELIGGNLSILYSLRGTPFDLDFSDKILFLEDLDEYMYHIDRMMRNLLLGGQLETLKGLVIGGMTDMNDHETPFGWNAEEVIRELVLPLGIPVAFNMPAGHINDNRTLQLGTTYTLTVTKEMVQLIPQYERPTH